MGKGNGQQHGRIGGFVDSKGKELPPDAKVGVKVATVEKSAERNPDGSEREYVTVRIALGPAPDYKDVQSRVDTTFVGKRAAIVKRIARAYTYGQTADGKRALDALLDEIAKASGA